MALSPSSSTVSESSRAKQSCLPPTQMEDDIYIQNQVRDALASHHLFGLLSKAGQERIVSDMTSTDPASAILFPQGSEVSEEGSPSKCAFYILKGEVHAICPALESRDAVLLQLSQGAFFGECGILLGRDRFVSVYARKMTLLLRLHGELLLSVLKSEPDPFIVSKIYSLAEQKWSYWADYIQPTQELSAQKAKTNKRRSFQGTPPAPEGVTDFIHVFPAPQDNRTPQDKHWVIRSVDDRERPRQQ